MFFLISDYHSFIYNINKQIISAIFFYEKIFTKKSLEQKVLLDQNKDCAKKHIICERKKKLEVKAVKKKNMS